MVAERGYLKKTCLYLELMICDKYRGKNTNPQCVNMNDGLYYFCCRKNSRQMKE
jgi:hypothetical protein